MAPSLLLLMLSFAQVPAGTEQSHPSTVDLEQRRILAALQHRADWDTTGWTLAELAGQLQARLGCTVTFNRRALEEFELTLNHAVPVVELRNASVRSLLHYTLRELELTWQIAHGQLEITTREDAEEQQSTFVLPVADLVELPGQGPDSYDYHSLADLITSVVEPDKWTSMTGPGPIEGFGGALVFTETFEIGDQAAELIATLRRMKRAETDESAAKQTSYDLYMADAHNPDLDRRITIPAQRLPLVEAIRSLGRDAAINIRVDRRALHHEEVSPSLLVQLRADNEPILLVLERIIQQAGLSWACQDEVLLVTSGIEAEASPILRAYPVHDLTSSRGFHDVSTPFLWLAQRDDRSIDRLLELVRQVRGFGNVGTVVGYRKPRAIVVLHHAEVHRRIEQLLAHLRAARELEKQHRDGADNWVPPTLTERLILAPNIAAIEAAKLVRELYPDCRMVRPFGDSLIVQADETTLVELYGLLIRLEIAKTRTQTDLEGGFSR